MTPDELIALIEEYGRACADAEAFSVSFQHDYARKARRDRDVFLAQIKDEVRKMKEQKI
jgi:hypothetical protein